MKRIIIVLGLAFLISGAEANVVNVNSDLMKKCKVKHRGNKTIYKGRCDRVIPVAVPDQGY